jgi:hypothetical protein
VPVASALSRKVSRTLQRFLVHRYTRSSVTPSDTEDDWGDEEEADPSSTSGLRCLYGSQQAYQSEPLSSDASGVRTVRTPALFVAPDDPLAVGDVVTGILDAAGTVLVAGPLEVEAITLNAELGLSVLKVATLRQAVGRRTE